MDKHQKNHMDNGIMDSIAALRSVLMLDTPIREAFAVGRTVNDRKQEPKKQLCFSPTSMTQATTPASRNTNAQTPVSRNEASRFERLSLSSPLFKTPTPSRLHLLRSPEVQQSATKIFEKKIELLEASHAELEERLKGEIDQRATLKTTYEKLSEFQTKQSSQLEQITVSRDTFRSESITLKKTLETERKNHTKTIAFLRNTTSNVIQLERLREKDFFRTETERLKKRLQKTDSRYAESELLVKSLTKEVERLNADLKKLRQAHESAVQKKAESHGKEIAVLQNKIEQTESGLVEQINKERHCAEENYEKLQKVQKNRTKLKEDFLSQKEKMKSEKTELQESLKEATDARKESERKLEEVTDEVSRLRKQVTDEQLATKKIEGKVEKLSTELDATKDQLAASAELQSERDELERRLRDAEEKSSKLPIAQDQSIPVDGLKELQSENRALQHQLKDSEEDRNQFQNELQETRMELNGLKQNLEEAERIELQNEDLVAKLKSMSDELAVVENLREQLKANEYDVRIKDQLVHKMELEKEKVTTKSLNKSDTESSNDMDGNNDKVTTIRTLEEELKKAKEELANLKGKLDISTLSNLNRLVEVATHREKVRDLEGDLKELEEKLNGESTEADENDDRKRVNEDEEISRKRLKMGEDVQEADDDDDIVL